VSDVKFGLRLSYEIRREFAPYIGVVARQRFGATAPPSRAGKVSAPTSCKSSPASTPVLLSAHLGSHFGVISRGGARTLGYFGGESSIKVRV